MSYTNKCELLAKAIDDGAVKNRRSGNTPNEILPKQLKLLTSDQIILIYPKRQSLC